MARFHSILALLLWIPIAGGALAQTREVCLDDQAGLNAPAMGSFYKEFHLLVGARGVRLEGEACASDAIRVSLYRSAVGRPADVLGAAPLVHGSRIAPRLEIYYDRVVALMPEAECWSIVGRALARVAAHEVAHFIDQDQNHGDGLLQARFSGAELAADDSYPFRWISSQTKPAAGKRQ